MEERTMGVNKQASGTIRPLNISPKGLFIALIAIGVIIGSIILISNSRSNDSQANAQDETVNTENTVTAPAFPNGENANDASANSIENTVITAKSVEYSKTAPALNSVRSPVIASERTMQGIVGYPKSIAHPIGPDYLTVNFNEVNRVSGSSNEYNIRGNIVFDKEKTSSVHIETRIDGAPDIGAPGIGKATIYKSGGEFNLRVTGSSEMPQKIVFSATC